MPLQGPVALNTRSVENLDLCFSYADDKTRHAAEMMHAVDEALQAAQAVRHRWHSTGKAHDNQT